MNERIRELQIQADEYADEIFDRKGKMYGEIVMERFAELIVAECVAIAQSADDDSWKLDGKGTEIARNIQQHFGVER